MIAKESNLDTGEGCHCADAAGSAGVDRHRGGGYGG